METAYTSFHTIPINPEKILETQKKNLRPNSKPTNPSHQNHFIQTKKFNQIKIQNFNSTKICNFEQQKWCYSILPNQTTTLQNSIS